MKRLSLFIVLFAAACAGAVTPRPMGTIVPVVNKTFTPAAADKPEEPASATFIQPDKYEWQLVTANLREPVGIQNADDGANRLFIVERAGIIKVLENGKLREKPFLDIRDLVEDYHNEQGLLGFAFHPQYKQNGYFYVNYVNLQNNTTIARFQTSDDPNIADISSHKILLVIPHPYHNNNAGMLGFGLDGYLYIATGDGGDWSDPEDNGQNTNALLGKILRIDIDSKEPYAIPVDNPFAKSGGAPEVWAYGLRNPWRFTFDPQTGDMYIGDVGQAGYEEVNYIKSGSPNGLNFGWDYREGFHRFNTVDEFPENAHFTNPIFDYDHVTGCAVISGVVYRGEWAEWDGLYLAADFCLGKIWALKNSASGWEIQLLYETKKNIVALGADETENIYMLDHAGSLYRLIKK